MPVAKNPTADLISAGNTLDAVPKQTTCYVFVYGTLLRGMCRGTVLSGSRFIGIGQTQGQLYDIEDYPGLVDGSGLVTGEIYAVDIVTLAILDRIEDYDSNSPATSLYRRITRSITCLNDGKLIQAELYLYNEALDLKCRILHGDYRSYIEQQSNEQTYYIAYGSNLNQDRLESRVNMVYVEYRGYLDGYELCFNKANRDGSSAANAIFKGDGYRLPFVAYRLPQGIRQLESLDKFECVPDSYQRICMPFQIDERGKQELGYIYLANPKKLGFGLQPKEQYLAHIMKGYDVHGFEWPY